MQINREEFLQEIKLRKLVREHISVVLKEEEQILNEENQLRKIIRKLIVESGGQPVVPATTGQAALDKALQATTTQVKDLYMELATAKEQRDSFRTHFLNALEGLIQQENAEEAGTLMKEEEIRVSVDDVPDEEKFIPPDDEKATPEEEEKEEFGIEGYDETGRDYAMRAFKAVQNQIADFYEPLRGPDRDEFADWLLTNYKLYMDRWEQAFETMPEEPESPEPEPTPPPLG